MQNGVDRELSHQLEQIQTHQGCSEGTSSVAFEALLINGQIDLINFLIFNCLTLNINLLIFNCLTSNFCFRKNVSDFKLTWENDDLLSSSHKYIFEVNHPVNEYIKMRIPDKRHQTNTVRTI